MKTGIIIQARLGSTRLPEKVLKPIHNGQHATIIEQIIKRAHSSKNACVVILATSIEKSDDPLVNFLNDNIKVEIFRGSESNVLSRYYHAAKKYDLEHIVRVTGDNPCIDAKIIDATISEHIADKADYSYTKGYPIGMNVEVIKFSALETAFQKGVTQVETEHVTYYTRERPKEFDLKFIYADLPKEIKDLRLTVDTDLDYIALRILFDYIKSDNFGMEEILNIWKENPYIFSINKNVYQKKEYKTQKEEITMACELLEKQEMYKALEILKTNI